MRTSRGLLVNQPRLQPGHSFFVSTPAFLPSPLDKHPWGIGLGRPPPSGCCQKVPKEQVNIGRFQSPCFHTVSDM